MFSFPVSSVPSFFISRRDEITNILGGKLRVVSEKTEKKGLAAVVTGEEPSLETNHRGSRQLVYDLIRQKLKRCYNYSRKMETGIYTSRWPRNTKLAGHEKPVYEASGLSNSWIGSAGHLWRTPGHATCDILALVLESETLSYD